MNDNEDAIPTQEIPPCIGHHAGIDEPELDRVVCDGGTNAEGGLEMPCSWRGNCINFQAYCGLVGKMPSEIFEGKQPEEIIALVTRPKTIDNGYIAPRKPAVDVKNLRVNPPQKSRKKRKRIRNRHMGDVAAKAEAIRVAREELANGASMRREHTANRVLEMAEAIAAVFERPWHKSRDVAAPGELYVVDRRLRSEYVGVYCQPKQAHAIPIAKILMKQRSRTLRLALTVPPDISIEPFTPGAVSKSGLFKSKVRILPNIPVSVVAMAVRKLYEQGFIVLPTLESK